MSGGINSHFHNMTAKKNLTLHNMQLCNTATTNCKHKTSLKTQNDNEDSTHIKTQLHKWPFFRLRLLKWCFCSTSWATTYNVEALTACH